MTIPAIRMVPVLAALALARAAAPVPAQRGASPAADPARLAIELRSPDAQPDLAALGARIGIPIRSSRRFGPRELRLLELTGSLPDDAARLAACRALAREPDVRFATDVGTGPRGLPNAPTRFVLVRFRPEVPAAEQRAVLASIPRIETAFERFGGMENAWRLESGASTGDEIRAQVAALKAMPIVKWAQPDRVLGATRQFVPNDPLFPTSWALDNTGQQCANPTPPPNSVAGTSGLDMDVPLAWDMTTGSADVIVVVLDDGVEQTHPDINQIAGMDFTGSGTGGGPVDMCSDHGTKVAGCITGIINNGIGTAGVAPDCLVAGASVFVPKTPCDPDGEFEESWIVDALAWAVSIGARITNSSFTADEIDLDAILDKYDETQAKGIMHFAATGNDPSKPVGLPAANTALTAVGGIYCQGSSYGAVGPELDFVGPAVTIQTTDLTGSAGSNTTPGPAGDFTTVNGTSFATPLTAGAAALVMSQQPNLAPFHVETVLEMTARDLGATGEDGVYGYGLADTDDALRLANEHVGDFTSGHYAFTASFVLPMAPYFNSLSGAVNFLPSGGLLILESRNYPGSITISKPMTMRRWDGVVTIGG